MHSFNLHPLVLFYYSLRHTILNDTVSKALLVFHKFVYYENVNQKNN